MEGWFRKHGKTVPPMELLLALIQRNFAIQPGPPQTLAQDDYEALSWWITQVLPVAAGNQCDWQAEHYVFMTVQKGITPMSPRSCM